MYRAWQRENADIIEVEDELDIVSSPALASAIDMTQSAERFVIVSLERCSYCDSTALGVLIKAKNRLGANLLLVLPPDNRINRVFDVTGVKTHLTPYASVQEAVEFATAFAPAIPPAA